MKMKKQGIFPKLASAPEQLGRKNSVLFTNFILWIMKDCIRKGIDKIYYFTREGIFFREIHETICRNNPYPVALPECSLLEVSRMSTFLPSLRKYDVDEWLRLWRQYPDQTLTDFFKSLNLPLKESLLFAEKFDMRANDPVFPSEKMRQFIGDPSFSAFISKYGILSRALLLEYLRQKGISEDVRKIAVVDIGWHGTIQDNLCYLLPNCQINGYYLGLVPYLNPQPENALKNGYINLSSNSVALLKSVTPLEFLTTSVSGSVVGFSRSEGGRVKADVIHNVSEDHEYEEFTLDFQRGVIKQAEIICKSIRNCSQPRPNLEEDGFQLLYRLMAWPDFDMAAHFFHLTYNEEFGLGRSLNRNSKFFLRTFIKAPFSRQNLQELRTFLNSTSWPQGYLKIHHMGWLLPLYNLILKRIAG